MDIHTKLAILFFLIAIFSVVAVIAAEKWQSFKAGQALVLAEKRERAMSAHPAGKGRI